MCHSPQRELGVENQKQAPQGRATLSRAPPPPEERLQAFARRGPVRGPAPRGANPSWSGAVASAETSLQAQRARDELPAGSDLEHLPDARAGDEARQPVRIDDEVGEVPGRLEAGGDADGASGVAEDRRAVPTEGVLLPGERGAGPRRAAGSDHQPLAVVPDDLGPGAVIRAARTADRRRRCADPAVELRVDLDQGEVVTDAVVVAGDDLADVDQHRIV